MVFPYRQDFVFSKREFMLKIYYQNINLGITVHNSKSSVAIFSRNIQLLMSTSIVIHLFNQFCHDCSIPQFVCDLSYFLIDSKCFTSVKLLFTISFSTEETIWNEVSQINVAAIDSNFNWIRLRRVFRCITNIERLNVFDSTSAYYIMIHKICETLSDSL